MRALSIFLFCLAPVLLSASGPLFVSTQEGELAVFDPMAWRLRAQLRDLDHPPALAFEAEPNRAWTLFRGSTSLRRLALDQARSLPTALTVSGTPKSLAWIRPHGPLAVITEEHRQLLFYHPEGATITPSALELPGDPVSLAYPPQANHLAVVLKNPDRICLIDTKQWTIIRILSLPYPAWDLEFSRDGRWVAASHEDHGLVSLVDLKGKQLARRLVVGQSPRGLALSPNGQRLWVAHQMGATGGISAINVTANAVVRSFRVVGETYGMTYLAAEEGQEARLVVAAYVPEAQQTGMLYALNLDLTQLISNQPMDGTPYKIHYPPLTGRRLPSPTATASPTPARALQGTATPTPVPRRRGHGLLRGGFHGRVQNEEAARLLTNAAGKVEAVNRRGRRYPGTVYPDGSFEIRKLPWGTYQLVFEIEGYRRKVLPQVLLAFTGTQALEVLLRESPATPTPPSRTDLSAPIE